MLLFCLKGMKLISSQIQFIVSLFFGPGNTTLIFRKTSFIYNLLTDLINLQGCLDFLLIFVIEIYCCILFPVPEIGESPIPFRIAETTIVRQGRMSVIVIIGFNVVCQQRKIPNNGLQYWRTSLTPSRFSSKTTLTTINTIDAYIKKGRAA